MLPAVSLSKLGAPAPAAAVGAPMKMHIYTLYPEYYAYSFLMYKYAFSCIKNTPQNWGAVPCPAVPLPKAWGCVLSAWFTFIYRTTGLHAVGVLERGLTDSRGSHPSWLCPSLALV